MDLNNPIIWQNAKIVWQDEFEGNSLNKNKWLLETGDNSQYHGWQNYTDKDTYTVNNGLLKIVAKKTGTSKAPGNYESARLNSKFAFTYGRLEMRAKLPNVNNGGLWAKLWMIGSSLPIEGFPKCGEMDFLSYLSHQPNAYRTSIITAENASSENNVSLHLLNSVEDEFHNYGVIWTPNTIKFYLDEVDNVVYTYQKPINSNSNNWPFSNSFYFIIDLAVGEEFDEGIVLEDSIFPISFEVDYVRVYHP